MINLGFVIRVNVSINCKSTCNIERPKPCVTGSGAGGADRPKLIVPARGTVPHGDGPF